MFRSHRICGLKWIALSVLLCVLLYATYLIPCLLQPRNIFIRLNDLGKASESDEIVPTDKFLKHNTPTSKTEALNIVKERTECLDKPVVPKKQLRGNYWVLYNYVIAEKRFKCHESITYTTHADYSFLDNLLPLLERWQGPISIALYAPGTDFSATIDAIAFLRECTSALIKEYVTFHIYFSSKHMPKQIPQSNKPFEGTYNCSLQPPYFNISNDKMYKTQKGLLYPVNVGRNIAREMASTYFILASDIELYPSPNLIENFLFMIAENQGYLMHKNPRVFPLHLFEVNAKQQVPNNKTKLIEMLHNGTAIPFHKRLCPVCHTVPKSNEWMNAEETKGLHVFNIGKRVGRYHYWEPIFIGTHSDPLYDERLSWEGLGDKMPQGYTLCIMDYDFLVLDNAFLVHKPGIKIYKNNSRRTILAPMTKKFLEQIIYPELNVLYGFKKGCT